MQAAKGALAGQVPLHTRQIMMATANERKECDQLVKLQTCQPLSSQAMLEKAQLLPGLHSTSNQK